MAGLWEIGQGSPLKARLGMNNESCVGVERRGNYVLNLMECLRKEYIMFSSLYNGMGHYGKATLLRVSRAKCPWQNNSTGSCSSLGRSAR